jgi:hypothetical protein
VKRKNTEEVFLALIFKPAAYAFFTEDAHNDKEFRGNLIAQTSGWTCDRSKPQCQSG